VIREWRGRTEQIDRHSAEQLPRWTMFRSQKWSFQQSNKQSQSHLKYLWIYPRGGQSLISTHVIYIHGFIHVWISISTASPPFTPVGKLLTMYVQKSTANKTIWRHTLKQTFISTLSSLRALFHMPWKQRSICDPWLTMDFMGSWKGSSANASL